MVATTPTSSELTAPTSDSGPTRILALDGLRGIAVAVVVLYHAGHLRGGFLGVDLFFVLSGFLITSILLRSTGTRDGGGLSGFWARRARRLLPAMLLMLAVVVPLYALGFASPTELTVLRREALATLAYVANWQQILSGQSYWAATLDASPLRHTWSLAVEEQFYLVWPLVAVFVIRRGGARALRSVAAAASMAAVGLTVTFARAGTFSLNSLYLSTITRSGALLAGAALAAWTWKGTRARRARAQPALGLELAAVGAAAVLGWMIVTMGVSEQRLYAWGLAVSAVCGTILVAAAAQPSPGPIVRVLHAPPLRYLGTISYGVYLWSWPIMQMVSERHTQLRGWPLLAAQVAFTIAAAQASWMFLERPILAGALRPPRSQQLLAAATIAAAIAIVAATAGAQPTDPTGADTGGYARSAAADAPRMLVVGDSVPAVLTREGISPQRDALGVSVVNRALPGCILLREQGQVKGTEGNIRTDVGPCNQGWRAQVAELDPDIVLVMFGQFANDQVKIDGTFRRPCDDAYRKAERTLLDQGLDDLTSSGARVVIATAPWSSVSWVTDSGPVLAERMTCLNDVYREAADARDDVSIVDLAGYVCPAPDRCLDAIDGADLRPDTVHFRDEGAEVIARWLLPQVLTGQASADPAEPADPYCATLTAAVADWLGASGTSTAEVVDRLRTVDPKALEAGAPPELAPSITLLADNWSDYLDTLLRLPAAPTPEQIQSTLGRYATPVTEIVQWSTTNC